MLVEYHVTDLTSIVSKSCKQQNDGILDKILIEIKLCSTTRSLVQMKPRDDVRLIGLNTVIPG